MLIMKGGICMSILANFAAAIALPNRELQLLLRHYWLLMALTLYSLIEHLTAGWLVITETPETLIIRIVKVVLQLILGLILIKRLASELRNEFDDFPKPINQPSLSISQGMWKASPALSSAR